jgi:hypothetical protein
VNLEDTGRLLALCASYDRRKVGDADVLAWHRVIGDLQFADCEQAVLGHYADCADWLMPAHIRLRVRETRNRRIQATGIPAPPPELLDDPEAYSACLHAAAVAIADGRDPHAAMHAIASRRGRELEAR